MDDITRLEDLLDTLTQEAVVRVVGYAYVIIDGQVVRAEVNVFGAAIELGPWRVTE